MRTVQVILKAIFFVALISPVFADTNSHETHHAESNANWMGVYNGMLPCDDCGGVKTTVALNPNKTYTIITQYVGRSIREFTEKGKFAWDEASKKLTLTPRSGAAIRRYLVGTNTLTELDNQGSQRTGTNASAYVLRKLDITAKEPKHLH